MIELEDVLQCPGETENEAVDLGALARNHAPTSELGAQTLRKQLMQEPPDSHNQPERVSNSRTQLLQDKAPNGDDVRRTNNVHLQHTVFHSSAGGVLAPSNGADYAYAGATLNPGHLDAVLTDYEPHPDSSYSIGDPEPAQFMTQHEDLNSNTPRIQAYAKLEFDDGEFYMNTYSVELGRDLEAARLVSEREQEGPHFTSLKRRRASTSSEEVSQASNNAAQEDEPHMAGSVVSESGGIIGPDAQESHKRKKPRLSNSKSATSSSQQLSRKSSMDCQNAPGPSQSPAVASMVDPSNLDHADPEACPLIGIHPPAIGQGAPASHKGISRRHVKIAFNFEKHVFELTILGRNGAFVDELWYKAGDTLALTNGSLIQIGGVRVRFLLPDMSSGEGGAEGANSCSSSLVGFAGNLELGDVGIMNRKLRKQGLKLEDVSYGSSVVDPTSEDDESGRDRPDTNGDAAYSFTDESEIGEGVADEDVEVGTRVESIQAESASELEELETKLSPVSTRARKRGKARAKPRQTRKASVKPPPKGNSQPASLSNQGSNPEPTAPVVKRKGPGRPPKNGIMSKREQKLLAKQAQEAAKATEQPRLEEKVMDTNRSDIPAPIVPTKRKYTKRKDKELQAEQDPARENAAHPGSLSPRRDSKALPKAPKEKKPAKRPRSFSPFPPRENWTEEQLRRPPAPYLTILYEILTDAGAPMHLPLIYDAVERKHPFYHYGTNTHGWQSSVRHNLAQHPVFTKIARHNKGFMWSIDPNVPFNKEKKRKAASPPRPAQHNSRPPQTMPGPENHQQPHMMHAQTFSPPYAMQPQPNHPQAPMMPNPYHYPGMSIPNGNLPPHSHLPPLSQLPPNGNFPPNGHLPPDGHLPHNFVYHQPQPPGQIPYAPPGSSYHRVGPTGLPLPLLKGVADPSSTYQSPYQPAPPIRPPQSHLGQQTPVALSAGLDGANDAATSPPPPPSGSEAATNHLPAPSPSPAPQSRTPGPPPLAPASTTSQEILQAISLFKNDLVRSMKDHKHGEALVTSAINRVLGHQTCSSLPGSEEDPQEQTIMQIFSDMLEALNKKSGKLQGQPSQPPSQSNQGPGQAPLAAAPSSPRLLFSPPPFQKQPGSTSAQLAQQLHQQPNSRSLSPNQSNQHPHYSPGAATTITMTPQPAAPNVNPNPNPSPSSSPSSNPATTKPRINQTTKTTKPAASRVVTPLTPPEHKSEGEAAIDDTHEAREGTRGMI